jgi:hypothetical protein
MMAFQIGWFNICVIVGFLAVWFELNQILDELRK